MTGRGKVRSLVSVGSGALGLIVMGGRRGGEGGEGGAIGGDERGRSQGDEGG